MSAMHVAVGALLRGRLARPIALKAELALEKALALAGRCWAEDTLRALLTEEPCADGRRLLLDPLLELDVGMPMAAKARLESWLVTDAPEGARCTPRRLKTSGSGSEPPAPRSGD